MSLPTSLSNSNARRAAACISFSLLMAGGLVGCSPSPSSTSTPSGTSSTTSTTPPMSSASAASR